jgi:hypothetical protein
VDRLFVLVMHATHTKRDTYIIDQYHTAQLKEGSPYLPGRTITAD